MKVFLSWSGGLSHQIALILKEWLPCVIQELEPYVSSEDIEKGNRWSGEIAGELEACKCGIICVTRENLQAPWLNFEAGALSKAITDGSKVIPFLFELQPSDLIKHPLAQFQGVTYVNGGDSASHTSKEDVYKLISTLNSCLEKPLKEEMLKRTFHTWWEDLREKFMNLNQESSSPEKEKQIDINATLQELLELNRTQVRLLESRQTENKSSDESKYSFKLKKSLVDEVKGWTKSLDENCLKNLSGSSFLIYLDKDGNTKFIPSIDHIKHKKLSKDDSEQEPEVV